MAQQTINIGTSPNDNTGDPVRDAFDKVNDNFNEVYAGAVATAVATTVELEDITDAINTDTAKVAGYMVFNTTTGAPVWAIGDADGDVWNDATGAVAHTPV